MITTVVFDIGGVFLHQPDDLTHALWYSLGVADPEAANARMFRSELWDAYKRGGMSEEAYWTTLLQSFDTDIDGGWQRLCNLFERSVVVDTKVVSLVNTLRKKYRVHALSNAGAELERRLKYFRIQSLFEHVINSHRVKMAKPDEAIYRLTCEVVKARPEEILFIDDKARNIRVAQDMGFHTHVFTTAVWLEYELQKSGLLIHDQGLPVGAPERGV